MSPKKSIFWTHSLKSYLKNRENPEDTLRNDQAGDHHSGNVDQLLAQEGQAEGELADQGGPQCWEQLGKM